MPVSTSSRRTRTLRREPSDAIEEDGPSQLQRQEEEDVEDDEEDEDQPRRSSKAMKKERKRGGGRASQAEAVGDDPLKSFGDQPLDKNHAPKIAGMAKDWGTIKDELHKPWYGLIKDIAASHAEFTEGEQGEQVSYSINYHILYEVNGDVKELLEIDHIMRELIDTENEFAAHQRTLEGINQRLVEREEISGIIDVYEEMSNRNWKNIRARQPDRNMPRMICTYSSDKQSSFEVQNPNVAMPPVTDFIPHEDGDDSDDDDDVQVGGVTQDYKCPLTLTTLIDPLTSSVCGHSFSAGAIREFLGPNKNSKKKCPASGCNQYLNIGDLHPDKELARRARDAARREQAREEDSDEEEVVE
ncbi:E3 SUMO-protein ligase nse2 [Grifola frondosa]|uniref:E3 SUMO-protein ligase nse2 n=1 Tax=Grifola frondosa TaxID=5627 RepID=A0A1C7M8R9_GRIFR|nr:E3 SUMO-protein ligase nse2 [Grifola frondosa]